MRGSATPWHCAVMTELFSQPTTSQHVMSMMDHGQFCLRGGLGDEENELPLLDILLQHNRLRVTVSRWWC